MKAVVITEPGQTETVEIDRPEPGAGDALLRVRLVGLCGSDLKTFCGRNPMVTYPRIPGHEIAATVEEIGPDAPESITTGMDVTLSPYTS